jgi:hypothetical protein
VSLASNNPASEPNIHRGKTISGRYTAGYDPSASCATDCGEHCQAAGLATLNRKKEKAAEAASAMSISVVALSPSIDVPRTISIGLTNAALDSPMRRGAVPRTTTAVVAVIAWVVPVMVVVGVRVITVAEVALRLRSFQLLSPQ